MLPAFSNFNCFVLSQRGKLQHQKCISAEVSPGTLKRALRNGQMATLPGGKTVTPADVTDPDDPGAAFIGNFNYILELLTVGRKFVKNILFLCSNLRVSRTGLCNVRFS